MLTLCIRSTKRTCVITVLCAKTFASYSTLAFHFIYLFFFLQFLIYCAKQTSRYRHACLFFTVFFRTVYGFWQRDVALLLLECFTFRVLYIYNWMICIWFWTGIWLDWICFGSNRATWNWLYGLSYASDAWEIDYSTRPHFTDVGTVDVAQSSHFLLGMCSRLA